MNDLFTNNPNRTHWKFEVIYSFEKQTSLSALYFVVNEFPTNGSCEINPLNGTIETLFTVSCLNWFDQHFIKDYSLFCILILFLIIFL